MSGTSVMLGCFAAAASSACCTAQPVASATWTMRRWLWPPSRVRCSALRPSRRERHAELDQPLRSRAARASTTCSTTSRSLRPGAGDHRVVDMRFEAVAFLQHRGDAALRPAGRAVAERALGDHRDLVRLGQVERRGQPGRAGADDEDVGGTASRSFRRRPTSGSGTRPRGPGRGSRRRRCRALRRSAPPAPAPALTLSLR